MAKTPKRAEFRIAGTRSNRRVGRDISRKKVGKDFAIDVTDDIRWSRKQETVDAEALLDGLYVIRTSPQVCAPGAA